MWLLLLLPIGYLLLAEKKAMGGGSSPKAPAPGAPKPGQTPGTFPPLGGTGSGGFESPFCDWIFDDYDHDPDLLDKYSQVRYNPAASPSDWLSFANYAAGRNAFDVSTCAEEVATALQNAQGGI